MAQLLARDSVYGRFAEPVSADADTLFVGDREIRALREADPAELPWADLGVDAVIESTGRFRTRAGAAKHLEAGARKVILSAPAKGDEPADATVVLGVNIEAVYDPEGHDIITQPNSSPSRVGWTRLPAETAPAAGAEFADGAV